MVTISTPLDFLGLDYYFGVTVTSGPEVLGLIGPNGSGRSRTLARSGAVAKADRGYQLPAGAADAPGTAQPAIPTVSPPSP